MNPDRPLRASCDLGRSWWVVPPPPARARSPQPAARPPGEGPGCLLLSPRCSPFCGKVRVRAAQRGEERRVARGAAQPIQLRHLLCSERPIEGLSARAQTRLTRTILRAFAAAEPEIGRRPNAHGAPTLEHPAQRDLLKRATVPLANAPQCGTANQLRLRARLAQRSISERADAALLTCATRGRDSGPSVIHSRARLLARSEAQELVAHRTHAAQGHPAPCLRAA